MKQGDVIEGRYAVERRLGGGAMATVYLATDSVAEKQVAIKLLNTDQAHEPRKVERFKREGRLICRLQHPHLVHGFALGEEGDQPFIAMEYIDGPSLDALIETREKISPEEGLRLLLDIALGLDYLFVKGAVQAHRDLKPANILISTGGAAKIADFGIAKAMSVEEAMTMTGATMGTAYYMSPEQCLDPASVDIRTDIYALGAIFYEMLTGEKAYPGKSLKEITDAHFELEPPQVEGDSEIIDVCNQILRMALAYEVEDRYQTPRALVDAILPFVGADVTVSLPRFSTRGLRTAAMLTAMGVTLAALTAGFAVWRSHLVESTTAGVPSVATASLVATAEPTGTAVVNTHVNSEQPGKINASGPERTGPNVSVGGAGGPSVSIQSAIKQALGQ